MEIWPEHFREGSWGWEIVAELAPGVHDTVLTKVRYDAFYGTPLDHLLRLWKIDTLVICGTIANVAVHYTAASAALRRYHVVIPRDASRPSNRSILRHRCARPRLRAPVS